MTTNHSLNTIATICARGGSKGLPGKNIRPFAGIPLIAHSIRFALQHPAIKTVYVSTDDPEIARIACEFGAEVPYLRPAAMAEDDSPKLPAIEHLLSYLEEHGQAIDRIVDLQPTSPLRRPEDLDGCLARADAPDAPGLVLSVFESSLNPYFTMVEQQPSGYVEICKGAGLIGARQQAPKVWSLNGSIYVWRREALAHAAKNGLWSVNVATYAMPAKRSVDIDTVDEFDLAQWYYTREKDGS